MREGGGPWSRPSPYRLSQGVGRTRPGRGGTNATEDQSGADMRTKATFARRLRHRLRARLAGRPRPLRADPPGRPLLHGQPGRAVDRLDAAAPGRRRPDARPRTRPPATSATSSARRSRPGSAPGTEHRHQRGRRPPTATRPDRGRRGRGHAGGPAAPGRLRRPGHRPGPARPRLRLPDRRRQQGRRPGGAPAHRRPGDPAGLERRLDLPASRAATSRRSAPTPPAAGSTATTTSGGCSATPRSTSGC